MNCNSPIIFEDGLQMRDFVSVRDIVQANLLAMDSSAADGMALNVGSGQPITLREVAAELGRALGVSVPFETTGKYRAGDIRHGLVASCLSYRILITTDAKVHIFDNLSRRGVHHNLKWLQGVAGNSDRLKVTIGDVRDAALVQRAVQVATEIYHFAAQVAVTTSIADPVFDFEVNVRGTLNVLEAA